MRSVAEQDLSELGGPRSVLSRQKLDHIELHRLLGELRTATPEQSGPLLVAIYRLVFPHAFAEETVLFPAIRRALADGDALTLEVEREHQAINELVTRLEALPRGSPEWRAVLDQVVPLLEQDVRDEEDALLPRLQQALTPGELRYLGTRWAFVRSIAPTRCHPIVSRRPPGNVLSALPLAVLDRVRDAVDVRRYREAGSTPVADRLSATLTRAAHAVERLPGMKIGEQPPTQIESPDRSLWQSAGLAAAALAGALFLRRRHRRATAPA
jgi:MYXO-CTERM domain-containing protein